MGKPKATASIPHTGITHTTSSASTHDPSSRGCDWLWFLLALVAVAVIVLA